MNYQKLLQGIVNEYTAYWNTPFAHCHIQYDLPELPDKKDEIEFSEVFWWKSRVRVKMFIRGLDHVFIERVMVPSREATSEEMMEELALEVIKVICRRGLPASWQDKCERERNKIAQQTLHPTAMYPLTPDEMFNQNEPDEKIL